MEMESDSLVQPSPDRSRKVRILLVLGIVLVFGVYVYYFKDDTKPANLPESGTSDQGAQKAAALDEADGWDVYTDEVYGFEIKYPGDILKAVEKNKYGKILESFDITYIEESEIPKMHVSVEDIKTSAFQDAKNEAEEYSKNASFQAEGPDEETIAGETVYVSTFSLYGGGEGISCKYYFPAFVLVFSYADNYAEEEFRDTEKKMLSSMRLVEKKELDIITGNGELDRGVDIAALQKEIDEGDQSWKIRYECGYGCYDEKQVTLEKAAAVPMRVEPRLVLKEVGKTFGFAEEDFKGINTEYIGNSVANNRIYKIPHEEDFYIVTLERPAKTYYKAWIISKIQTFQERCREGLIGIRLDGNGLIFEQRSGKLYHLGQKEYNGSGYGEYCVNWYEADDLPVDVLDKLPENESFRSLGATAGDVGNPKVNWNQYSSPVNHLAFRYPEEWSYRSSTSDKFLDFCKDPGAPSKKSCWQTPLQVAIDFISRSAKWEIIDLYKIVIDGKKGYLAVSEQKTNEARAYFVGVRTLEHDIYFEYEFSYASGNTDPHQDTFRNILASVKIVRETDTSAWQEYSGKESGYYFKYPQDWEIYRDYLYQTGAGAKADEWTVELRKKNGDAASDFISINFPQFDCMQGRCWGPVQTNSRDEAVRRVFDGIVATFKDTEK